MSYDANFVEPSGAVYNVPVDSHTLSTAGDTDLFCVTASTLTKLLVREIRIGQYTEFGDAQAELLPIRILTGSTAPSSGTAGSLENVAQHTGALTASSAVVDPSTTLASTVSAKVRVSDSWNVAAGYLYAPLPAERIVVQAGETVCVRVGLPNDPVDLNATLTVQEIGI